MCILCKRMRLRLQPHFFALIGTALAVASMIVLGVLFVLHAEWSDARQALAMARSEIGQAGKEADALFRHLEDSAPYRCTEAELLHLRGELIDSRFIRDIGLYDSAGRLYCTAVMGRFAEAVFDPPSRMIDDDGQLFWFDMPLLINAGATKANVIRRGDFQIVFDPFLTRNLQASGIDTLWYIRGKRSYNLMLREDTSFAMTLALEKAALLASEDVGVDWGTNYLLYSTHITRKGHVAQIVRTLGQIINQRRAIIGGTLLLCLLIALPTYFSLLPLLRSVHKLKSRIRQLCTEAHVRCFYQPIVDLASRRVVGCEVLMRLHDGKQMIYPDQAIPAIIKKGLTWELDRIVSRKAIAELAAHLPTHLPAYRSAQTDARDKFKVAFNFFPENLSHPEFAAHLAHLQAINGDGLLLNLEVTEYSFVPESIDILHALKKDGYLVSVDDFGTGYSNLGTIKRVAPDYLKIDKSFVFDMEDHSLRSNLIPEIVAIANAIGADVIGEGVENEQQAASLSAHGVRFGQGYYFARPMPIGEFISYLENSFRD